MSAVMHAALRQQIAEMGRALSPALFGGTRQLYEKRMAPVDAALYRESRDCSYGPDERHVLDLFQLAEPGQTSVAKPAAGAPIFVFVHGGGFVMGSKGGPDDIFYNNVGRWAARQGYVGVTLNYRLAPQHGYPAGIEDLARAVDWLRDNAARWGGDANAIVLS